MWLADDGMEAGTELAAAQDLTSVVDVSWEGGQVPAALLKVG